jgi:hypothetical protein
VQVYAGGLGADLALPDDVPIAALTPELWDSDGLLTAPGRGPLDPALDLHDNGVRDGALLVLAPPTGHRAPAVIDASAAVAAQPTIEKPDSYGARVTGGAAAALFAGVAGFLTVPGTPGLPHVLLASAATAVISVRLIATSAGAALVCLSVLCTVAALAGTVAGLGFAEAGVILTVTSLALIVLSGRIAVAVCGLSDALTDPDELARRTVGARRVVAALVGGAAAGAGLGVPAAGFSWPVCALAAVTGGVLVLRARESGPPRTVLLIAALCCMATALVIAGQLGGSPWLPSSMACGLGMVALWLGSHPGLAAGDVHVLAVVENALLVAVAPLACWAVGGFGWIGYGWIP